MPKLFILLTPFLILIMCSGVMAQTADNDLQWLGEQIYRNETGGNAEHIIYWSDAEEFPSLGIGHFIWIPKETTVPFEASFPAMVEFVTQNTTKAPPNWVRSPHPPWRNRAEFVQAHATADMQDLRGWLNDTRLDQAKFIMHRFETRMKKLIASLPADQAERIQQRYYQLMQTRSGRFALIDYSSFKGFGDHPEERYDGLGWGALQTLESLVEPTGSNALNPYCWVLPFSDAAIKMLSQRVNHSPPARNEARWLPGWKSRIDRYGDAIPSEHRQACKKLKT